MFNRFIKFVLRLRDDQSGSVMVFFCVFLVVILVFALSVMNVGDVAFEKTQLQNAADFAALSGATWEARAMNIEGLLNVTITASIVIEIVKCVLTGVPPDNIPPTWINLQLKAQQWIQEAFNKYFFGTGMTVLGAWNNRQAIAIPQPFRVPLYVYRYSFAKALAEGARKFKERTDERDEYYRPRDRRAEKVQAKRRQEKRHSLFSFKFTHELAEMEVWPQAAFGHKVPIFAGKTGGNCYSQPRIVFSLPKIPEVIDQLEDFIAGMFTTETGLNEKLREIIHREVTPRLKDVFKYDGTGIERFRVCLPQFDWTVTPTEIAAMTLRILPRFTVTVEPKPAQVGLVHGDISPGERYKHRLFSVPELLSGGESIDRWYDPKNKKEFWPSQVRQFHLFSDDTKCYLSRIEITPYCAKFRRGRCVDWDYIGSYPDRGSRNYERRPGRAQVATDLGAPLTDCSKYDYPGNQDKTLPLRKCHKRTWWYLSFSVSFDVIVKAYLDIDFSAILMAKYRGFPEDYNQLGTSKNSAVKTAVVESWHDFKRNIYVVGCRFSKKLPFGHSLMGYEIEDPEITNKLYDLGATHGDLKNIEKGRRPLMLAYGPARHWQMGGQAEGSWPDYIGNHRDISELPRPEKGLPIYFKMNWFSVPHLKPLRIEEIRRSGKGQFGLIEGVLDTFDSEIYALLERDNLQQADIMTLVGNIAEKLGVEFLNYMIQEEKDKLDVVSAKPKKDLNRWPDHNDLPDERLDECDSLIDRLRLPRFW